MFSKFSTLIAPKQNSVDAEIMENIVKDLYKKVEERLSCACLIHRDIKIMVMNHIMEQKPYLSKVEAEKRVEVLLRNCYEEYKHEKDRKLNVFHRSFRKMTMKKETACKCHMNTINCSSSKVEPAKNLGGCEKLDKTECRCHITCAQPDIANILKPLERFITTNRSFRLRLKHLDKEKYGHLETDSPVKSVMNEDTIVDSHRVRCATPKNCFCVNMEDTSTPNGKPPQYRFRFGRKPPASFEESMKKKGKGHLITKSNSTESSNVINETFVKESQSAKVGSTDEGEQIVTKIAHCDNHCFLCMLEEGVKKERQLVYCKRHCPNCIPSQMEAIAHSSLAVSDTSTAKASDGAREQYRTKSKSDTRVASKLKSSPASTNLPGRLDKDVPKPVNRKQRKVLKDGNKENSRWVSEDEITVVKDDAEESCVNDCLEWDSLGLGGGKHWTNTLVALDDIKRNHVRPIREDISDMQQYFRSLLSKYKS